MKKVIFTFKPKRYTLPYTSTVTEQFLEFMPVAVRTQIISDINYCASQGWVKLEEVDHTPVTDSSGKGIWVDLDKNTYVRIFECPDADAFMNFFQQQYYYKQFFDHYDANQEEASYSVEIVE